MSQNAPAKRISTKRARNQKLLMDAVNGATNAELQEKYKLSRQQVTRILSGKEMREISKAGESELLKHNDKAIAKYVALLDSSDEHIVKGVCEKMLVSSGSLKVKQELELTRAKPTVIHKPNGSAVVLGTKEEDEE